jgi:hypothetical protein
MKIVNTFMAGGEVEQRRLAASFQMLARSVLAGRGTIADMRQFADRHRANERVQEVLKAAVSAGSIADPTWGGNLAGYASLAAAFLLSLTGVSVFDTMLPAMIEVPLRTRIGVSTVAATGTVTGEGQVIPPTVLNLTAPAIEPKKANAFVVMTEELARFAVEGSVALFNGELAKAVTKATDLTFLAGLASGAPSIPSAGTSAAAILADLRALLQQIDYGPQSRLFWMLPQTEVTAIALLDPQNFRNVTIGGGDLAGVEIIPTDDLPANTSLIVDATGIMAQSDTITLDSSKHALLDLQTAPDSPPGAATVPVSLFQSDTVALRATRWFGFQPARTTAVAALTGIAYSEANSP